MTTFYNNFSMIFGFCDEFGDPAPTHMETFSL